jgi:hypothetical protein
MSLTKASYSMITGSPVNVFDYMTAAQIADVQSGASTLAVDAAVAAAIAVGGRIIFPSGKYRFANTLTITNIKGLVLEGAAASLVAAGTFYASNTVFNFDNAGSGTNGIDIDTFIGLVIKNIVISFGHAGGGSAIYLHAGHDFTIENVKVSLSAGGSTSKGIVLGGGTGATSTFLGRILNCKVLAQGGASFESNNTNTSLTFENCYQVGGYFNIVGTVYSSFISCASEGAPDFGYLIGGSISFNSTNLTFTSCAGEANGKGVFYLSTYTQNIVFLAPYGSGNNTLASVATGDLINIDSSAGFVKNISIFNPTSLLSNAATVQNIYATASTGLVDIYSVDTTLLPQGVKGDATWFANNLTVTGDTEIVSWTPTLVGWTNVGAPTITGKYVKKGTLIYFIVVITPGTSISATLNTSTITGIPMVPSLGGVASMVDGNVRSLGSCAVSSSGIIYPQTTGVITVSVTIAGTFSL